jgi:hypothetical protein
MVNWVRWSKNRMPDKGYRIEDIKSIRKPPNGQTGITGSTGSTDWMPAIPKFLNP